MTLTQQFLVVSILPLSFLALLANLWLADVPFPRLRARWTAVLLFGALWATNVLRTYGGVTFPDWLVFSWGVIARYLFLVTTLAFLLATAHYLLPSHRLHRIALGVALFFSLIAFGLDPFIWNYDLPPFGFGGFTARHFDLWAAVWIASWGIAVVAAWILAQQVAAEAMQSRYRSRARYWRLVVIVWAIGGGLSSVQQPGQPLWSQLGVLVILLGALIGTVSIVNAQLPELHPAMRQMLSRLAGGVLVFGIIWLALWLIARTAAAFPQGTDLTLLLILVAAGLSGLFTLLYRPVQNWIQRLFLADIVLPDLDLTDYVELTGYFPDPSQLGLLFLQRVREVAQTNDLWLWLADDGPAGQLVFRPLVALNQEFVETAVFAGNSPVIQQLRAQNTPLALIDIEQLPEFAGLDAAEKQILLDWQRQLYVPLRAGKRLVAVLGVGNRPLGGAYSRQDWQRVQALSTQFSPLLLQGELLSNLHRVNEHVFQQNQSLLQDKQHLGELNQLYRQFIQVISPELKRPFTPINNDLHKLETSLTGNQSAVSQIETLRQEVDKLKVPIDHIISMAARIQPRGEFDFTTVRLEDVIYSAIRHLRTMADARRISVEFAPRDPLPAIRADEQQLREAVQYLLHNAIKFNKLGGSVALSTEITGGELTVHIEDTGVGIPPERLETIWAGFGKLNGRLGRGSGLGLPLTQFIVAAHGGRVEAASKYGAGSTFSIHLPITSNE